MKKLLIGLSIGISILFTGCASTSDMSTTQPIEQNQQIVYCSDCGEESSNVDKFCSKCGVEAKWVSEKPEIEEDKVNESQETEEVITEVNKEEPVKEEKKVEEHTCEICGRKYTNGYEGFCSEKCFDKASRTKADVQCMVCGGYFPAEETIRVDNGDICVYCYEYNPSEDDGICNGYNCPGCDECLSNY